MMAWLVKQVNKKNKGFTLIEMVVVMAIIAVLIAIAVPQVLRLINKSKVTSDRASAKLIATAVQQFMADGNDVALDTPKKISDSAFPGNLKDYLNKNINNGIPKVRFNSSWDFWIKAKTVDESVYVGVADSSNYYVLYPDVGILDSSGNINYSDTANSNNPYYKFK